MMKICYVICPLGPEQSQIRNRSDTLLETVIKPIVKRLGYEVLRADITYDQQKITDSISDHIFRDDLVVADLTDCNPNVCYELGKRHAWGGKCVHLTQNIGGLPFDSSRLPFDVRHYRVIEYDLSDAAKAKKLRGQLRVAIEALQRVPPQCPFPLTPDDVISLSGSTVLVRRVTGHRDHYYLARDLVEKDCTRMFLMQRSSSLILGPEQGWGAEEVFYNAIFTQVNKGVELLHIVSLDGIARHLARPESTFPDIETAIARLENSNDLVAIKGRERLLYLKKLPDIEANVEVKPDRQARIFVIELTDRTTEGVVVFDLGTTQSCFHLKGPEMGNFMRDCIDFYQGCKYLRWDELYKVLGTHVKNNPIIRP